MQLFFSKQSRIATKSKNFYYIILYIYPCQKKTAGNSTPFSGIRNAFSSFANLLGLFRYLLKSFGIVC